VLVTGASGGIGSEVVAKLMEVDVGRLCMFLREEDALSPEVTSKIRERIDGDRYRIESLDLREP